MPTDTLIFRDVSDPETLSELNTRLATDLGAPLSIYHELDWIKADVAQYSGAKLYALLAESVHEIRWFLPVAAYSYRLRVALGPLTLWRARVLRAESRDLRTLESDEEARTEERIVQALACVRRALPGDAVLFLSSVPESLTVKRAFSRLSKLPEGYRNLRWGPAFMHRVADISGGLEEYLKRLGSKTRADLRRTRRRFDEKARGNSELFVAKSENDVERLVDSVLTVAPKTWQYVKEKAGPRYRKSMLEKYRTAARKSMLRSYVLYVDGQPIAFQIGYVAHGVFDAHEIGYDPQWEKSQPGILLHAAIVEDLGVYSPEVSRFDFGITDRLHKSRLSTEAVEEGFYYLFPNSMHGRLLYESLRMTMALTDLLKVLRERLRSGKESAKGS